MKLTKKSTHKFNLTGFNLTRKVTQHINTLSQACRSSCRRLTSLTVVPPLRRSGKLNISLGFYLSIAKKSEPATSNQRCFSSKYLLPVSLTGDLCRPVSNPFLLGRIFSNPSLLPTRVNNFAAKDLSEMYPLWDGDREDQRADNIVEAMFSSSWVWEESHWPLVGTKLWTNVKVEIHPMKTEDVQKYQAGCGKKVTLLPLSLRKYHA
ncbi:hypothetical protein Bca52824_023799 [Brassica carinata]|uniref:Uncharacterized protein n=1 Tax=Brassica carinata TaxID=52824 RepID=A0A8X7VJ87_BRACI|nr:hypothetical protein Bca52824_023799 [Brassica carinata]